MSKKKNREAAEAAARNKDLHRESKNSGRRRKVRVNLALVRRRVRRGKSGN